MNNIRSAIYVIKENADIDEYIKTNLVMFVSSFETEWDGYLEVILSGTYDELFKFFKTFIKDLYEDYEGWVDKDLKKEFENAYILE